MTADDLKLLADCEELYKWNNQPIIPAYLKPLLELVKRLRVDYDAALRELNRLRRERDESIDKGV